MTQPRILSFHTKVGNPFSGLTKIKLLKRLNEMFYVKAEISQSAGMDQSVYRNVMGWTVQRSDPGEG